MLPILEKQICSFHWIPPFFEGYLCLSSWQLWLLNTTPPPPNSPDLLIILWGDYFKCWKNFSHHRRPRDLSQGQKALLQLPPLCALSVLLHLLSNWLPAHGLHTMCLIIRIINGKTRSSQVSGVGLAFPLNPPHNPSISISESSQSWLTYFLITLWSSWKFFWSWIYFLWIAPGFTITHVK